MTNQDSVSLNFDFAKAEEEQLRAWIRCSTAEKVAFFEEMIDLAYRSGALTPERLKLRDK